MKRLKRILPFLAMILALTGCGGEKQTAVLPAAQEKDRIESGSDPMKTASQEQAKDEMKKQRSEISAFSLSPEEWYHRQIPGILIDQGGYAPSDEKIAVFRGSVLPTTFEVRDQRTDATILTEEVNDRSADSAGDMQLAFGDFSALTEPGEYYLFAEWMGESVPFTVNAGMGEELLTGGLKRYYLNRCGIALTEEYAGEHAHGVCHNAEAHTAGNDSVAMDVSGGWHMDERADRFVEDGARIVQHLLLAFEMSEDSFGDDTGIPESGNGVPDVLDEVKIEINWLLKMQDARLGGVYDSALTIGGENNLANAEVEVQPVTREASVAFATALAKFSYVYRRYDSSLATTCLRAADRAFSWYLQAGGDAAPGEEAFAAAAELYRATGQENYREMLASCFEAEDFYDRLISSGPLFMGAVTYLQTAQEVDRTVSGRLMQALTADAEEIADEVNRSVYGAPAGGFSAVLKGEPAADDREIVSSLLHGMQILAVCDHVSYSYEYTKLLEESMHALRGRNPACKNYLTGFEGDADTPAYPGIVNQPVENAALTVAAAILISEGW
ncbi:MAG: glycoside hydrolase family 9 protein [Lachnospiraceae bacterium]|nr:glycoside hydrolase family 9 protein [Lachnospiraceae bacterium]